MEFKDWQIPIVELLLSGEITENNPLRVQYALQRTSNIGRSSVQVFLKGLADAGLISRREQPARGGYHGVYWATPSLTEMKKTKIKITCEGCGETKEMSQISKGGLLYKFFICKCGHESNVESHSLKEAEE